MPINMFCFDANNKWVHVYTITDLLDAGQLPIVGAFIDVNEKEYTLSIVSGKYRLAAKVAPPNPNPNARLNTVFANILSELDSRLAGQTLTITERSDRRAEAVAELDVVRNKVNLGDRFTAMKTHQFGHPTPPVGVVPLPVQDPASTRGGWLHNLFCH